MDKGYKMKTQDFFRKISETCCLIACYSFCSCCSYSEIFDIKEKRLDDMITQDVYFIYYNGSYLDKNNNCIDGYAVLRDLSGYNRWSIDVKQIAKLEDTGGKLAVVEYAHNNNVHNVVVFNNEIIYNPLSMSVCVNHGKPVKARIINCGREINFPSYIGVK